MINGFIPGSFLALKYILYILFITGHFLYPIILILYPLWGLFYWYGRSHSIIFRTKQEYAVPSVVGFVVFPYAVWWYINGSDESCLSLQGYTDFVMKLWSNALYFLSVLFINNNVSDFYVTKISSFYATITPVL